MYLSPPVTRVRVNGAVPGIALVVGALLIGFGSTRPWASAETGLLSALGVDLTPAHDFSFSSVYLTDGDAVDLHGVLVGLAVVAALCGLALTATRIRGLGLVWRSIGWLALLVTGGLTIAVWNAVDNPDQIVAGLGGGGTLGRIGGALTSLGLASGAVSFDPGTGLWLVTVGAAVVLLGLLVPAGKRHVPVDPPPRAFPGWAGPPPPAAWQQFPAAPVAPRTDPYGPTSYWPGQRS